MSASTNSEPTAIPAPNVRRTLHSKLDSLGRKRRSRGAIHHFRMDLYSTGKSDCWNYQTVGQKTLSITRGQTGSSE